MFFIPFQNRYDITLFTLISMERLQRLSDLVENWDWPISAGIAVTKPAIEIPKIVNAWLNNPKMRRNVDVHLLFDDRVKSIAHIYNI